MNGVFAEITYPYGPEDYTTVVDEWKAKQLEPEAPWYQWIHALAY
jgi:hypothetical protein